MMGGGDDSDDSPVPAPTTISTSPTYGDGQQQRETATPRGDDRGEIIEMKEGNNKERQWREGQMMRGADGASRLYGYQQATRDSV
jgi:hypothetical protein